LEKKTAVRIVTLAIVFILLAGVACLGLVMCSSETPFEGMRTATINGILDRSGAKERLEAEMYAHADDVAESAGIPVELVNTGIEMLNVTEWKAVDLPADAEETATFRTQYRDQQVTLTTYDDPSLVTLGIWNQSVCFKVPESTQTFTTLAPYASSLQDLGLLSAQGL
jgi:hypothetical protein